VHGVFECDIQIKDNTFEINGQQIIHCNSREPEKLPWAENDIDVVIEATGKFKTNEEAGRHLQAGAKKVVITAPGKDVDNTIDRKSTRLNSSHVSISYAVFCLK